MLPRFKIIKIVEKFKIKNGYFIMWHYHMHKLYFVAFESNKSPSRSFTRNPVRTLVFYSRKSVDHVLLFTGPGGQIIPVYRLGPIMIGRLFDLFRTRTVLVPISSSFGPGPYFVLIRSSSRPRP